MTPSLDIGCCSLGGRRERNEDFAAVRCPAPGEEALGAIAAIADGVSTGGFGREAAQTTALSLLADYHAAPDTWDTTVVLDRLIGAQNGWLADHNRRRQSASRDAGIGMTTLTALVLRGHAWTLAHVGDTRAWLLRPADRPAAGAPGDGEDGRDGVDCVQLTHDHAFDHPDQTSRLTRAVGLDDQVRVDYLQGELRAGDVFVLTSDGVHGVLKPAQIGRLVASAGAAQEAAEALARAAIKAGSRDNASAVVVRVASVGAGRQADSLLPTRQLPVPAPLRVGDRLDGYLITALVASNGVHRLYQARDPATQQLVAVKTLHEARAGDPEEREMLAHEAWLASRVAPGGGFVAVRDAPAASAFYAVFDWHAGRTLEQLMAQSRSAGRGLEVAEVVEMALAASHALGRLHRLGIVHRDIKPGNLHLGDDGVWRILDLGVAVSGSEPKSLRTLHAGTPSYMNPEQWARDRHVPADAGSDLYALGCTLYQALSGALPYGEIEPYQGGRFRRDPKPLSRWRTDVPMWLDHIVLKAVALDPKHRFETAEELTLALERGASRPLAAPGSTPLAARDPAALWKIAFAVALLFDALLIYWLLFLPR